MQSYYQGVVCSDCEAVISNGPTGLDIEDGKLADIIANIARVKDESHARSLHTGDKRDDFSKQPCVCCHDWRGGYRVELIALK